MIDLWDKNSDVSEKFKISRNAFIHRIPFVRNYLTHLSLRPGQIEPEFSEIVDLEFHLNVLIEACILRWLKMPEAVVREQIGRRAEHAPVTVLFEEGHKQAARTPDTPEGNDVSGNP